MMKDKHKSFDCMSSKTDLQIFFPWQRTKIEFESARQNLNYVLFRNTLEVNDIRHDLGGIVLNGKVNLLLSLHNTDIGF